MEKMPQEEVKRMQEIQETMQDLGTEKIKARKYTRRAKDELAKKPEVASGTSNEAIIPMAEAQIKRRRAMAEAKKTEKSMGEVNIVKPEKTPAEIIMEARSKKLKKATETAEEAEKVLYAPKGDEEKTAKRHEDQLKILREVAEGKAAERSSEGAKQNKKDEAMKRFEDLKNRIETMKKQKEAQKEALSRIISEKEAREAEGRELRQAEDQATAYEQLTKELKKPEQAPKKKSWWERTIDWFR